MKDVDSKDVDSKDVDSKDAVAGVAGEAGTAAAAPDDALKKDVAAQPAAKRAYTKEPTHLPSVIIADAATSDAVDRLFASRKTPVKGVIAPVAIPQAAAVAAETDPASWEPPPSSREDPISLSDLTLDAREVRMPSLPPGTSRPSAAPAARSATRPPPSLPARKTAPPPALPSVAPASSITATPLPKPSIAPPLPKPSTAPPLPKPSMAPPLPKAALSKPPAPHPSTAPKAAPGARDEAPDTATGASDEAKSATASSPPPKPTGTPGSNPPGRPRAAAWEHEDASAPRVPTSGAPPAAASKKPPPARPRPPPRPIEEVEAEVAPPSAGASIPAPAPSVASAPSPSRGWMVGLALIAAGAIVYMLANRQPAVSVVGAEAESSAKPSPPPPPSPDALLADYDAAIIDGDLARASDLADRLGTLAPHDPRVLVRQAGVVVVKADRASMAARLVAASDAGAATPSDDAFKLPALVPQALAASEAALAAAPEDTTALLARIDALRIAGTPDTLAQATALATRVEAKRVEPEVAYTLGALELAVAKPQRGAATPWIADLQRAAAVSPKLARPQALLTYLLAERGDVDAARETLHGLETPAHPNPLLEPLRVFIASRPPITAAARDKLALAAPSHDAPTSTNGGAPTVAEPPATSEDTRPALALSAPALVALGDAAHAKGDRGAAQTYYERALALSPGSYAASLGLADVEWETGARSKATARYTRIAEKFPNASPRVKERLAQ